MKKEIYNALKKVIEYLRTEKYTKRTDLIIEDIQQLEIWIDEVAKEYED